MSRPGTDDYDQEILKLEKGYSAPMPWVGVYVAAASLVCTLAMTADLIHGFRQRKLWFPCKYFTLNAVSLMLIAVAMKLPVDLNSFMQSHIDMATKINSNAFICIIMANFMPSIGSMNRRDLLTNVIAMGILVITIFVNMLIQIFAGVIKYDAVVLLHSVMLSLLLLLISSALMILTSKKILERKYLEIHGTTNAAEQQKPYTVEKLIEDVSKYWIMEETSNPQFVLACSPNIAASGVLTLLVVLLELLLIRILYGVASRLSSDRDLFSQGESDYKCSVFPIFLIQSTGVLIGSIAPFFRLFRAFSLKCSLKHSKKYLHVYKIEGYWTQMLVDRKSSRLPLQIGCLKCQKLIYMLQNFILNCMIGIQIFVVIISKTTQLITMFPIIILTNCCFFCTWLMRKIKGKLDCLKDHEASVEDQEMQNLKTYVLQLQDEVELASRTLNRISNAVQKVIKESEKNHPKNLMKLLEKSNRFAGVTRFDNDQVPSMCSLNHPNSWSLVVVTSTSIVLALAEAQNVKDNCFLSGVSEGLQLVHLIEESLGPTEENLVNVRKAASKVWLQVVLRKKWMDEDLKSKTLKGKTSLEILQWLSDSAKEILSKSMNIGQSDSSLLNVLAANSMYRISQSVLMDHEGSEGQTEEMLLDELCVMIADILSSCLSNLQCVIAMKCYADAIEQREATVRTAARLVGQTKQIMEFLQQRQLPYMDSNKLGYIDEWYAFLKVSSNRDTISSSSSQSLSIAVE